jgi:hypothetical protein
LSFLKDNSIDAIITDHAYDLKKSLKGGNRDFAAYECFQYTQEDFDEKYRVLKKGCFLLQIQGSAAKVALVFLPDEYGSFSLAVQCQRPLEAFPWRLTYSGIFLAPPYPFSHLGVNSWLFLS